MRTSDSLPLEIRDAVPRLRSRRAGRPMSTRRLAPRVTSQRAVSIPKRPRPPVTRCARSASTRTPALAARGYDLRVRRPH